MNCKIPHKKKKTSSGKIISAQNHHLLNKMIPPNPLQILYQLQDAEFKAFLVGGGIRDLLLGFRPKDFDIATNASLNQVRRLFRNCRLIGRRFRIAHVYFHREIIEVSAFPTEEKASTKQTSAPKEYGKIEDDAKRRDFTINALYYDPHTGDLYDFYTGFKDLQGKTLRMIGNAKSRYQEDPVRMLRAARFAGKLGFSIASDTERPIKKLAHLLQDIPSARLFDEVLKLFYSGHAVDVIAQLRRLNLLKELFPRTDKLLNSKTDTDAEQLIFNLLKNTDARIASGKSVAPTFLFAVFLWHPLMETINSHHNEEPPSLIYYQSTKSVISEQIKRTSLPKRITTGILEIWALQQRLEQRRPKHILQTLRHPRFRAAYDLLLLRSKTEQNLRKNASWWTKIQTLNEEEQLNLIDELPIQNQKRRKKSKH